MSHARPGFLPAILSFGLIAAAAAQDATPTPPAATAPAPPAPATPVVRSPGNAEWAADPDQARQRATAEGKLLFVEFDRKECGHCRRMDGLLYPAFDFEALLVSMAPVKVDLDSPDGRELAQRYGVRDAPSILITTPEGRLVFLMEGFVNPRDFYPRVHRDLDSYRRFAREVDAQDIPKLAAREALDTGRELYQRSDPTAARSRLKRAIAAPGASAAEREEAREILAAVELDLGEPAAARTTIERLIATTKDPDRRERAELFRAQIPLAERKPAEALALFRRFLREHPASAYRAQVDALIAELTKNAPPR